MWNIKVHESQYKPVPVYNQVYNPAMTVTAEKPFFFQFIKNVFNSTLSLCRRGENSTEVFKSEMRQQIGDFFAHGLNVTHLNEKKESVIVKFETHINSISVITNENMEKTKAIANELNGVISPLATKEKKDKLEGMVNIIIKAADEKIQFLDIPLRT